jgi:predicted nucleic acid-binding protein
MTHLIDSSGWLEYLTDGANSDFFAGPIHDAENLVTPTLCLYEIFKWTLLKLGEERALEAAGIVSEGELIDLNPQLAIEAAQISTELKLAMADSIILATARAYNATLWTQDAHFKDLDGVRYIDKTGGS